MEVHFSGHPVPSYVLKSLKVVNDVEETIVEKRVVLNVMIKLQTGVGGRI